MRARPQTSPPASPTPAAHTRWGVPSLAERMAPGPPTCTIAQAATELHVSRSTIHRWAREGALPASGPPRRRRIAVADLQRARRFLAAGRRGASVSQEAALHAFEAEVVALVADVRSLCAAVRRELDTTPMNAPNSSGGAVPAWPSGTLRDPPHPTGTRRTPTDTAPSGHTRIAS